MANKPRYDALDGCGRGAAGRQGEVLKPLLLWQPEPILPGEKWSGRVVVEVLATVKEARGTYTLTLWDAERQRTVTLGNVTFP